MPESSAPLLDYLASSQARDEGMQKVTVNNKEWMALALLQLEQIARSHDGWANTEYGVTGEDIRVMLIPYIGKPHSSNAWGVLICEAVRRKMIVATGQYRSMKDKRSHARKTAVYVFQSVMP